MCTVNKSVHTKKVWKLIKCTSYQSVIVIIFGVNKSDHIKRRPLYNKKKTKQKGCCAVKYSSLVDL